MRPPIGNQTSIPDDCLILLSTAELAEQEANRARMLENPFDAFDVAEADFNHAILAKNTDEALTAVGQILELSRHFQKLVESAVIVPKQP